MTLHNTQPNFMRQQTQTFIYQAWAARTHLTLTQLVHPWTQLTQLWITLTVKLPPHSTHTLTAETSINTPLVPNAESTPIKPTRPQTQDSSTSPMIKNNATLDHSLSLSTDTPLSETEERLNTALIRRKLEADPKRQTIICKTKGQPLVFQRVVKPRKSTDTVRTPTKRKRASYAEDLRSNIAGP